MVPRYVAAREDRMKLDPDGPQSRVQGHGQDQELSRAAHLHVYVLLLTCLQVIGTFAAGLIRFDYQPPPRRGLPCLDRIQCYPLIIWRRRPPRPQSGLGEQF